MKKIGCVIAYNKNHNNYGTSLQGYATLKAIEKEGYECRIIKYVKCDSLFRRLRMAPLLMVSGGWQAYMRRKKKYQVQTSNMNYSKSIAERTVTNNKWKDEKMEPYCDVYVGYNDLHNGSKNYGLVLVGSDQVWTPLGLYSRFYNLLFVDDSVPRMSYASSFGVSVIPWWQRTMTRRYLERINMLSVREIKAKEIVDSLSKKDALVVLDPTFLLSRKQWQKEIDGKEPKASGEYIFCYLLGKNEDSRREIIKLKEATGLKIVALRHTDEFVECDETFGDEAPYNVDPLDFVNLISKATYVCTDSFHCTVFSIIFQRKFLTFYRFANTDKNSRNSRIDSILSLTGLNARLYNGDIVGQMLSDIDYEYVEERMCPLRNKSLNFLRTGLALSNN